MNKKLQKAFDKMEATKEELFAIVGQYSIEQQRFRPSEKEWSMLDVVEHLAEVEARINLSMKKSPINEREKRLTFKNYIYCRLFHGFFLLPTKVKAPKILKPPQSDLSLKEWLVRWDKERLIFKNIVEDLKESQQNVMVFKHPAFGPMNMFHTILFYKNHIKHHLHQIKRISKSQGFPN